MTPEQQKAANSLKLKAQARLRLKTNAPSVASGETGVGGALNRGFDSAGQMIGRGIEGLGELTGIDSVQAYGKEKAESNEADMKARNFKRPEGYDGITKNILEGDVGEALGSLGYSAVENLPSVGTGAVASVAAIMGGPVAAATAGGATALGGLMALGEVKQEKIDKGVNSETGLLDLGTAAASAAVELVPGGKAATKGGKIALGFFKEGAQEAVQEALPIGNAALEGADYTASEVALRVADAGITGGVVSKVGAAAADTAANAVGSLGGLVPSRTDDNREYTPEDAEVRDLLISLTDGDLSKLGNVSTTEANVGAQSYAKAAVKHFRKEEQAIVKRMSALAKLRGNQEAAEKLQAVNAESGDHTTANTEFAIDQIQDEFAGEADLDRLRSVHRMIADVQGFAKGGNDLGGLSGNLTRYLDPTDTRNTGITKAASLIGNLPGLGVGLAINRTARGLDNLTNRRSRIKRYVDSVTKSGVQAAPKVGDDSTKIMEELNRIVAEAKSDRDFKDQFQRAVTQADAENVKFDARVKKKSEAEQVQMKQATLDQSKAVEDAREKASRIANTREMFETGVVPQNDVYFTGYNYWQQAVPLPPGQTASILQELENEGQLPPGFTETYATDIYSFKGKKKAVINYQRLALQRAKDKGMVDPEYVGKFEKVPEDIDVDIVMRKLHAGSTKVTDSRRKEKAVEGSRLSKLLNFKIEKAEKSLSPKQYQALVTLKAAIDRPDVEKDKRVWLVGETIPSLFRTKAEANIWTNAFWPLAIHGNDKPIFQEEATEEVPSGETPLDKKKKKVKKVLPKEVKTSTKPAAKAASSEFDSVMYSEKTADAAIAKLGKVSQDATSEVGITEEVVTPASAMVRATEPNDDDLPTPKKTRGQVGLSRQIEDRVEELESTVLMAEKLGGHFEQLMSNLRKDLTPASRVSQIIYELATDDPSVNQIIDTYATKHDVPPMIAASRVLGVIQEWQAQGVAKMIQVKGQGQLKVKDKYIVDAEGKRVASVLLRIENDDMSNALKLAKAVAQSAKMVSESPNAPFTPTNQKEGVHKAFKDIPTDRANETFGPMYHFINAMRNMRFKAHPEMVEIMEDAIEKSTSKKVGQIGKVLNPMKNGKVDKSPMNTLAQMLFMFGTKAVGRTSTVFRMEWFSGRNGRTYSSNGLVHSQAGDMMKGIMRTEHTHRIGSSKALDFIYHSFGNLMGNDKASPAGRRGTIFDGQTLDLLLKYADNPFPLQNFEKTSKGNATEVSQMVAGGEGEFQVLNVALEVKRMVNWARDRHKAKQHWNPSRLLQDSKVRQSIVEHYETDFIVQMDASNNAYQIMGLLLGDITVLEATGLSPTGEGDPDLVKGGDIYVKTANAVVERIPELKALGLTPSQIRKLFKKPISTYLYAASLNSRKAAFAHELDVIVNERDDSETPIVGIGETQGLIQVPDEVINGMLSEGGFSFRSPEDDYAKPIVKRIGVRIKKDYKTGESKEAFYVDDVTNPNAEKPGGVRYASAEEAISAQFESDLYGRMSHELILDFETRYPNVKEFMSFMSQVSSVMLERGKANRLNGLVNVPTPDGMMLQFDFDDIGEYETVDVEVPSKDGSYTANLGVRTGNSGIKGRGLGAFVIHSLDAYVLRTTHAKMADGPEGLKSFNPIHDSIGFHPSDAERGQATMLEVMQSLGQKEYNMFVEILMANNLMEEYRNGKIQVPSRSNVTPRPASQIPTAFS